MKTQKYLVTIEMPDGDLIGSGWIKDIIQADCDVEDIGRQKVSVIEIKAEESSGKNLDEAADEYAYNVYPSEGVANIEICDAFKRGAKWQKEQMMKEAVEAEVYHYIGQGIERTSFLVDIPTENFKQEVRIIIVKEEDK